MFLIIFFLALLSFTIVKYLACVKEQKNLDFIFFNQLLIGHLLTFTIYSIISYSLVKEFHVNSIFEKNAIIFNNCTSFYILTLFLFIVNIRSKYFKSKKVYILYTFILMMNFLWIILSDLLNNANILYYYIPAMVIITTFFIGLLYAVYIDMNKGIFTRNIKIFYNYLVIFLATFINLLLLNFSCSEKENLLTVEVDIYIMLLIITFIIMKILINNRLFIDRDDESSSLITSLPDDIFKINIEDGDGNASKIKAYYIKEKPYLNKNLKLRDIALALSTNETYISREINKNFHMKFPEFNNYYRIEEALRLFSEKGDLTVIEVCSKAGFNNRASFNNAFKLYVGNTPAEWLKLYKVKEEKYSH